MKTKTTKTTTALEVPETTIGIDLGERNHAVCAMDAAGEFVEERKIANNRDALSKLSKAYPGARIVMEVGSHSPWISRLFEKLGHEVFVANPRKLRAIYENERKCDQLDAQILARVGRLDPKLLYPIAHQSEQAQRDLLQIKLRDNLVRQRVDIISSVRFTLKSLGVKISSSKTSYFPKRAREQLTEEHGELLKMIEPSLQVIDEMTKRIKELDKRIEQLGIEEYPESLRLQQIRGIGPITALTFLLTIGDPKRFAKSRDVGAYLGLVPKRDQSGESDKQLRISKAGDGLPAPAPQSASQYMLGPFGEDCDLRRHGLELAKRGGRSAKKKAVVAIARKLSVIMHTLWSNQSDYKALRNLKVEVEEAA